MRDCAASKFGCSCTVSCKIEADRKKREQTLQTIMARQAVERFVSVIGVFAFLAVATASALTLENELARQDRADQSW